jgi:hypothetical protein
MGCDPRVNAECSAAHWFITLSRRCVYKDASQRARPRLSHELSTRRCDCLRIKGKYQCQTANVDVLTHFSQMLVWFTHFKSTTDTGDLHEISAEVLVTFQTTNSNDKIVTRDMITDHIQNWRFPKCIWPSEHWFACNSTEWRRKSYGSKVDRS